MTEASLSGAGLYIFAALPLLFLFGRNECSRVGAEGVEQQLSLGECLGSIVDSPRKV